MAANRKNFLISETSPAAASTVAGAIVRGLSQFDWFTIDASLVGATGGALDVYLQRAFGEPGSETWVDWLHFTQLTAGAAAIKYFASCGIGAQVNTLVAVGYNASPVLAAGTFTGGHPGDAVRALYVAGASTSAGAAVAINIAGWRAPHQ